MREFQILLAGGSDAFTIKAEKFGTYSEGQTQYYRFTTQDRAVASFPMQSVLGIVDVSILVE